MIDLRALSDAIETHGTVARVVIAGHRGSTPRETGTSMLVWDTGQSGTIGGGRLEFETTAKAREMMSDGGTSVQRQPLGPALGQCCGGAVTLVTEVWDALRWRNEVDDVRFEFDGVFARRVEGSAPLSEKLRRRLRSVGDTEIATELAEGWLIEQVWQERRPVFIYGAGHVGQALARVLRPLRQFEVTLVDVRPDRLLDEFKDDVAQRFGTPPHDVMCEAPADAAHFIMTPEHEYDLKLCDTVLRQPFAYAGLIGSATKWARFRSRLKAMGHTETTIDQIECPIGDPSLGKRPEEIAIGVAARLLSGKRAADARGEVA